MKSLLRTVIWLQLMGLYYTVFGAPEGWRKIADGILLIIFMVLSIRAEIRDSKEENKPKQ